MCVGWMDETGERKVKKWNLLLKSSLSLLAGRDSWYKVKSASKENEKSIIEKELGKMS